MGRCANRGIKQVKPWSAVAPIDPQITFGSVRVAINTLYFACGQDATHIGVPLGSILALLTEMPKGVILGERFPKGMRGGGRAFFKYKEKLIPLEEQESLTEHVVASVVVEDGESNSCIETGPDGIFERGIFEENSAPNARH
jgi:hypothetical protein